MRLPQAKSLFALVYLIAQGCCDSPALLADRYSPAPKDHRIELILLSWHASTGWHFAILSQRAGSTFRPNDAGVTKVFRTIHELETALASLPKKDHVVTWRDDRSRGLVFPPDKLMDRIRRFAAARSLDLQVIPTIYD